MKHSQIMSCTLLLSVLAALHMLAGGQRAAATEPATVDPPFTATQLLDKIRLRDRGDLTPGQLLVLVRAQGWSCNFTPETFGEMQKRYSAQEVAALFDLLKMASVPSDGQPEPAATANPALVRTGLLKKRLALDASSAKDKEPKEANSTKPSDDREESSRLTAWDTNQSAHPIFFASGAKFQNPYAIGYDPTVDTDTGKLNKQGNDTVSFLSINWVDRYALVGRGEDARATNGQWMCEIWPTRPDISAGIGIVFGGGLAATNYSAATLAGGGDFYANLDIGLPLWRHETAFARRQFTIELGGGVSTEKDFLQVHTSAFFGLGYELGYRAEFLGNPSSYGLLCLRAGFGPVDVPVINATETQLEVKVDGGLPQFNHRWAPVFSVTFAHPLTENIYLLFAANVVSLREVYSPRTGPDQWSITVGASIPMSALKGIFAGVTGR